MDALLRTIARGYDKGQSVSPEGAFYDGATTAIKLLEEAAVNLNMTDELDKLMKHYMVALV